MTDSATTPAPAARPKAPQVEFLDYHRPLLEAGRYTVAVQETISGPGIPKDQSFDQQLTFDVQGPRFALDPREVFAVFPPAESLGDHTNVLPHVSLRRSTLPWEREGQTGKEGTPWLALLVFDEGEEPKPKTMKLSDLVAQSAASPFWPGVTDLHPAELTVDGKTHGQPVQAQVIEVEHRVLKNLLPSLEELELSSHVRKGILFSVETSFEVVLSAAGEDVPQSLRHHFDTHGIHLTARASRSCDKTGSRWLITDRLTKMTFTLEKDEQLDQIHVYEGEQYEVATVIANRLPTSGRSTGYLVSVEGRYVPDAKNSSVVKLDWDQAADHDLIRLVSLKSWSFSCPDKGPDFTLLLEQLDRQQSVLRLPPVTDVHAEPYLAGGCVPLPHGLRRGARTVSWYHGPLIPGDGTDQGELPIRSSDELLRYDPELGLFDVSYAAAWELGRLLTLQSGRVSLSLFHWKRQVVQAKKQLEQQEQLMLHLPIQGKPISGADGPPDVVADWFRDLSLLRGLPFHYLVPDAQLLPAESIRFFQVDTLWVDCLLDGAFSIGRVSATDHTVDGDIGQQVPKSLDQLSGFLLRSQVVAGWPGLSVDGYGSVVSSNTAAPNKPKLPLLRMERLSPNVLLCLFVGEVNTVDIHLKPEALHFGLDRPDVSHPDYYKMKRNADGVLSKTDVAVPHDDQHWHDRARRILNVKQLAQDLVGDKATSAQLALQLIEGVPLVRFTLDPASANANLSVLPVDDAADESEPDDERWIDVNRADEAVLELLPRIGPVLAREIVELREQTPFTSLVDLERVSGIGPKTRGRLEGLVRFFSDVPGAGERIDVNRADEAVLELLPRVGPVLVREIVELREQAPFASLADLQRVSGIGPAVCDALEELVTW